MKKRGCTITAVVILILAMTVQVAIARAKTPTAQLEFIDSTAYCYGYVEGNNSSNRVTISMALWQGNTRIAFWSDIGTGSVELNKSVVVTKGQTYRLVVNGIVAGTVLQETVATGTC